MDSFTAQNVDLSLVFCFPPFPGPVASYSGWTKAPSDREILSAALESGPCIATLVTLDTDKNFN